MQQKPEPADQATEVVADGCEDGVGSIAPTVPEIVSAHAMLGFEMADHRLDGGPSTQLAFVVALLIFSLGAGISIHEGVMHTLHPAIIANPKINYIVLGRSFVFEATT